MQSFFYRQLTKGFKPRSLGFWRPHLDHVTFGDFYGVGVTLGLIGGDHAVPLGHVAQHLISRQLQVAALRRAVEPSAKNNSLKL